MASCPSSRSIAFYDFVVHLILSSSDGFNRLFQAGIASPLCRRRGAVSMGVRPAVSLRTAVLRLYLLLWPRAPTDSAHLRFLPNSENFVLNTDGWLPVTQHSGCRPSRLLASFYE